MRERVAFFHHGYSEFTLVGWERGRRRKKNLWMRSPLRRRKRPRDAKWTFPSARWLRSALLRVVSRVYSVVLLRQLSQHFVPLRIILEEFQRSVWQFGIGAERLKMA